MTLLLIVNFLLFSIEHLPNERDRVFGMTSEDRFLRKQWLNDQLLTAREPVYVPELYPKNIIRRTLAAPWNVFFNALRPVLVSVLFISKLLGNVIEINIFVRTGL